MKTSRILTFIFTLLLVCVMIPVMAQSAAAADYDLWIGDTQGPATAGRMIPAREP